MKLAVELDKIIYVCDVPDIDKRQAIAAVQTLLETDSRPSSYFADDSGINIPTELYDACLAHGTHSLKYSVFVEPRKKEATFEQGYHAKRMLVITHTKTDASVVIPSLTGNVQKDEKMIANWVNVFGTRSNTTLQQMGIPHKLVAAIHKDGIHSFSFSFLGDNNYQDRHGKTSATTRFNIVDRVNEFNRRSKAPWADDTNDYVNKFTML